MNDFYNTREFMLEPISEIFKAADFLDQAANAHLEGDHVLAASLIKEADMPILYQWTDALWGKVSHDIHRIRPVVSKPAISFEKRCELRMPDKSEQAEIINRDGYNCQYCNIPVIRKEVRDKLRKFYPDELRWGRKNHDQHAAFQCMWLTYDHVVPHSYGGNNSIDNVIVSCQPCNCAKMQFLLEEIGLADPRNPLKVKSDWDGLERIMGS